jgi:signal transduction histidine kinase
VSPEDAAPRVFARAISAVHHAVAGAIQAAGNSLYVLRRRMPDPAPEVNSQLEHLDAQLARIRVRLSSLMVLPEVFLPLTRGDVSVRSLLEEALESVPAARNRLRVTLSPSLEPIRVMLDAGRVVIALGQLLTNAVEHSPKNSAVDLSAAQEGSFLVLSICSEGLSNWPTPPEKAIDPLYTTKGGSLGLGLAIAQAVADSHEGRLVFRPVLPASMRVELHIPLLKASEAEVSP